MDAVNVAGEGRKETDFPVLSADHPTFKGSDQGADGFRFT